MRQGTTRTVVEQGPARRRSAAPDISRRDPLAATGGRAGGRRGLRQAVAFLRRRRLALAATGAAVLFAVTVAILPGYIPVPPGSAPGWLNLPLTFVLFGYVAVSLLLGALASLVPLLEGPSARPAGPRPRPPTSRAMPGAAALRRPPLALPVARPRAAGGRYVVWGAALVPLAAGHGQTPPSADGPSSLRAGRALDRLQRRLRERRAGHLFAATLLGALVLLQGLAHLGERSASWATGRPRDELAPISADGYVFWLEGWPLQSDSSTFVESLAVMSGRRSLGEIDTIGARTGRMAYPFIVSLITRLTAPLGSVFAGFLAVNLALWWVGSLAVYDLTRQARHSWTTGLLGGALAASGIGFTFMAGNAMSTSAAYGAVPIMLWILHRLRVFAPGARWSDLTLTACLSGVAGLLNSLAPFYLGFALFAHVGRTPVHRLLLWAAMVVAVGVAWDRALDLAGGPPGSGLSAPGLVTAGLGAAAPLIVVLAGAALFARLPRRWGEWLVGLGVVLGVVAIGALLSRPQTASRLALGALSSLHVPDYLLLGGVTLGGQFHNSWGVAAEALRQGSFFGNILAAFPPVVLVPALVGIYRLPRRWREWALGVAVSAALVTFVMNSVTGTHHPRILFIAFPAVYLLAASGLRNLYDTAARYLNRPVAVVAVAVAVLAIAVPANASLWGDWSYAYHFHYVIVD